jgi:hypothetical protein
VFPGNRTRCEGLLAQHASLMAKGPARRDHVGHYDYVTEHAPTARLC